MNPQYVIPVVVGVISGLLIIAFALVIIVSHHLDKQWLKGFVKGMERANNDWKEQAINNGAAHYQMNPRTGEVEFQWKKVDDAQTK